MFREGIEENFHSACDEHREMSCLERRIIKALSRNAGKGDWKFGTEIKCKAWQKLLFLFLFLYSRFPQGLEQESINYS